MNCHIMERIASEKSRDVIHSIDFFVGIAAVISVVGLAFFAVL